MRIQFQSDLHLEFMPSPSDYVIPQVGADVIVIAGDIGVKSDPCYVDWVLKATAGTPTVVIAGNHEPYGSSWQSSLHVWRQATANTHVHFLEKDQVEIQGVRFLGTTLFTDYELRGNRHSAMAAAASGLNDHHLVQYEDHRFTPGDALLEHRLARQFLKDALCQPYPGQTVVVTHHAPSPMCWGGGMPAKLARPERLAPAYVSNLEWIMEHHDIQLWFHGHLHHSVDVVLHGTRVLSNPRGYWPDALNPAFEPDKVVEI